MTMTVRQLIEQLAQFDGDLEVVRGDYTWQTCPIETVLLDAPKYYDTNYVPQKMVIIE